MDSLRVLSGHGGGGEAVVVSFGCFAFFFYPISLVLGVERFEWGLCPFFSLAESLRIVDFWRHFFYGFLRAVLFAFSITL